MNEWFAGIHGKVAYWLIGTIGAIVLPLVGYLALQTVSKPHWSAGADIQIATNIVHKVIFVANPGPWKTRRPIVEFNKLTPVQVVSFSAGVTVKEDLNKLTVSADDGLPAGAAFFVVIKYDKNIGEPRPAVVCEGKICKNDPTFDSDLSLTALSIVTGIAVLASAVFAVVAFDRMRALRTEKESQINQALGLLLQNQDRRDEVDLSARAVGAITSQLAEVVSKAQPTRVVKGKNGKK